MCLSAADKKRAGAYESLEHGMNQTPPISCRVGPCCREKDGGGVVWKVKPANDVWDRDEVDGDLRYIQGNGQLQGPLLLTTYTR